MKILNAWLEDVFVGRFVEHDAGAIRFHYDSPSTPSISLSMRNGAAWPDETPARFLDNLLPDRPGVRSWMARCSGAESADVFDLLAGIGGDVAGGLILAPPDYVLGSEQPFMEASDDVIAHRIATLKQDPELWADSDDRPRFSLAGSQAKFALANLEGRWYWSSAALPSTHILKPGNPRDDHVEQIEAASMRLARMCGIPTPEATVFEVFDQTSYIVERFDRDLSSPIARRIHVEDLAQAAGLPAKDKYRLQASDAIGLLRRFDPSDETCYQFIRQLAFNTAVDNADAHAKNYSLLIRPSGIRLSPIYDVAVIGYWPDYSDTLAMPINGVERPGEMRASDWAALAGQSGLDPERVVWIASDVAVNVANRFDDAFGDLPSEVRDRCRAVVERSNAGLLNRTHTKPCGATTSPMNGAARLETLRLVDSMPPEDDDVSPGESREPAA